LNKLKTKKEKIITIMQHNPNKMRKEKRREKKRREIATPDPASLQISLFFLFSTLFNLNLNPNLMRNLKVNLIYGK